jgi:hypothetical protein
VNTASWSVQPSVSGVRGVSPRGGESPGPLVSEELRTGVQDDDASGKMLAQVLRKDGYAVLKGRGGAAGCIRADRKPFDLDVLRRAVQEAAPL